MSVSKTLKGLARYVSESTGEERTFALCVFTDVALKEGTKDAERYCASVLAEHLSECARAETSELVSEVNESDTMALKVIVDQLTELTALLDRSVDKQLLIKVVKDALSIMRAEKDHGVRNKLTRLLRNLGVPFDKIPSTQLAVIAFTTLATRLALAA